MLLDESELERRDRLGRKVARRHIANLYASHRKLTLKIATGLATSHDRSELRELNTLITSAERKYAGLPTARVPRVLAR